MGTRRDRLISLGCAAWVIYAGFCAVPHRLLPEGWRRTQDALASGMRQLGLRAQWRMFSALNDEVASRELEIEFVDGSVERLFEPDLARMLDIRNREDRHRYLQVWYVPGAYRAHVEFLIRRFQQSGREVRKARAYLVIQEILPPPPPARNLLAVAPGRRSDPVRKLAFELPAPGGAP